MKNLKTLLEETTMVDAHELNLSSISRVDEGFFDNLVQWGKNIKDKLFKRWGVILAVIKDRILPAISPFNLYSMLKDGKLNRRAIGVRTGKNSKKAGFKGNSDNDIIKNHATMSTLDMWKGAGSVKESFQQINEEDWSLSWSKVKNVNEAQLMKYLNLVIKAPKTQKLCIWGAPGIGKTAIVTNLLKNIGSDMDFISLNTTAMNPDDFTLPVVNRDENGNAIPDDVPKTWLPCYKESNDPEINKINDRIANGGTAEKDGPGGILFFDEISRCKPSVQQVLLQLIQDRSIQGYVLGSKWATLAAANRRVDDVVSDINFSKALGNRFKSINFVPGVDSWIKWAETKNYMSSTVLNFLKFNEKYWYLMDPEDEDEVAYATPRSWEAACQTLKLMTDTADDEGFSLDQLDDDDIEMIISSSVGPTVAGVFMTYYELTKKINPEDIVDVWKKGTKIGAIKDRMDIANYCIMLSISSKETRPTSKEFVKWCEWVCSTGSHSIFSNAYAVICEKFPECAKWLGKYSGAPRKGVPSMEEQYPDDWKTYEAGLERAIELIPSIDGSLDDTIRDL